MMQGQPGAARLALHHSYVGVGKAWRATEGKSSGEEKAIYEKALPSTCASRPGFIPPGAKHQML
ncbi:MAG TPA: hypothetical protein VHD63_03075, partial [Ktedonobacteraceae bacterium]|nr:hypothetical protein [Ktedonobacteraceae bacterium]